MNILHCCLGSFFCDGYKYQENILPEMNKKKGHNVEIIAHTEKFFENGEWGVTEPGLYYTESKIPIIRLPYSKILPRCIMRKLRVYQGLYKIIEKFSPDVILCHGGQSVSLLTVKHYIKRHPQVKLYIDNHADFHNSATNFISRNILHKIIYKCVINNTMRYVDKYLYITHECKYFLEKMYNINSEHMVYYPLGGTIIAENERLFNRSDIRSSLDIKESDIVLIHSGKLTEDKKTEELISAFDTLDNTNMKLVIVGVFANDYGNKLMPFIKRNKNIIFVGWKSGNELIRYLCASDLYIQPGTQSATMQTALCCGTAVAITSVKSHRCLLGDIPFYIDSVTDIKNVLENIANDIDLLDKKKQLCFDFAHRYLDYDLLAEKLATGFEG